MTRQILLTLALALPVLCFAETDCTKRGKVTSFAVGDGKISFTMGAEKFAVPLSACINATDTVQKLTSAMAPCSRGEKSKTLCVHMESGDVTALSVLDEYSVLKRHKDGGTASQTVGH